MANYLQSEQSEQSNSQGRRNDSSTSESILSIQTKEKSQSSKKKIHPKSEIGLIDEYIGKYDWEPNFEDPKRYITPLFLLCQHLSAYPTFRGADAGDVADYVETIRSWETFDGIGDDESGRDEFIATWQSIREPGKLGRGAYMIALENVESSGILPVKRPAGKVTKRFTEAVNVCYRLQQVEGDAPMALSCRTFGEMLGIHFTDADMYLRRMVYEGFMNLEEAARKKMQRAARYRFTGQVEEGTLVPSRKTVGSSKGK